MSAAIDFSAGYALAPDLAVVRRGDGTIQIGTEQPRRVLIADAPPHAAGVLAHLAGAERLSDAIEQLGGDAEQWRRVFRRLAQRRLLEPVPARSACPPHLTGEWMTLIHRLGRAAADRVLSARADATVVIEGSGTVADAVGGLLDAAGIGRIHQWAGPDAPPPGPTPHAGPGGQAAQGVRHQRPATQMRPDVMVLAGSRPATPGRLAALVSAVLPHLPVVVTNARLIVGPLVLPGRSTCVNCIDRHRRDADPDRPTTPAATPPRTSVLLAHSAAILAAAQVLDFVDAVRRPASIGATLEQVAGSSHPQQRIWPMHEGCRCRDLAALPVSASRADRTESAPAESTI